MECASHMAQLIKNPPAVKETQEIHGLGRSPGEDMASHCSILAWKIAWTEESGGLQPMGSQRLRHDLATKHRTWRPRSNIWLLIFFTPLQN